MTINTPVFGMNICGTYTWSGDTLKFYPSLTLGVSVNGSMDFDSVKEYDGLILCSNRMYRINSTGDTLTDITYDADTFPAKGMRNMKYILKR